MKSEILLKSDINIDNYHSPISTPTDASKGGVLLYVNKKNNFKPRPNLKIYEPKVLESNFIEIINPNKANDIVGVIYRHPTMDVDNFNDVHIRPLISKLSLEQNKNIFIAGDFNINLMTHHQNFWTFCSQILFYPLLPYLQNLIQVEITH